MRECVEFEFGSLTDSHTGLYSFVLDSLSGFETGGGDWLFPATVGSAAIADLLLSSAIIDAIRRSRLNYPWYDPAYT